jgi:DNA-binding NtrC family response regulator
VPDRRVSSVLAYGATPGIASKGVPLARRRGIPSETADRERDAFASYTFCSGRVRTLNLKQHTSAAAGANPQDRLKTTFKTAPNSFSMAQRKPRHTACSQGVSPDKTVGPTMNYDPSKIDLLLVDDDPDFRESVARRFVRRGFKVQEATHGEQALQLASLRQFDVIVLDMVMPGLSGIQVLEQLKLTNSEAEIIMLTGQGTIETAVQAMKLGAYDFLTKPFPLNDLEALLEKAYERQQLRKENEQLKEVLHRANAEPEIVGQSPPMQELLRLIERAGKTDKAILIQGESGTGKELVARALQRASSRADRPMVTINCAALPETLLESELFGHEKGAFTGAVATKPGLFEVADKGTLFIDEIGELAGPLQAKLLRVIEDGSMRRVGSIKERRVNVRLIAATNRNMEKEVAEGRFREDLYYRINVMSLQLPPLRDRRGDIPLLIRRALGDEWTIEPAAMQSIESYRWPGNVRQLFNALERAQIMSDDHCIHVEDLPREVVAPIAGAAASIAGVATNEDRLNEIQRAHVLEILERERGNKARAARALGINRRSLYRLIDKFGLDREAAEKPLQDGAATPS